MKTFSILFMILFLGICSLAGAQETPNEIKRVSVSDVFLMGGFFSESINAGGIVSDFNKLAPQSVLLKSDFSDYNSGGGYNFASSSMLSITMGIVFRDKEKKSYRSNPLLRLGISHVSATSFSGGLFKEERKPFDTLYSSQTGQATYVDSVINRSLGVNYSSEQVRLDASLIFRTNPLARVSLYSGIGIATGVSFKAYTDIYYGKGSGTQGGNTNGMSYGSYFYSNDYSSKSERFTNRNNFSVCTSVPLGIDLRIGKKNEFFKMMHLFYELRPGINMTSVPELGTLTNTCIQMGLGLRVSTR